jgi:hypothetical protein
MARRGSRTRTLAILAEVPVAARRRIKPVLEEKAKAVNAAQRAAAPKKTGALAASVTYTFGDVALASSGILAGGMTGRSKGSKSGGSAGGVLRGDADLSVTLTAGNRTAWYARQDRKSVV